MKETNIDVWLRDDTASRATEHSLLLVTLEDTEPGSDLTTLRLGVDAMDCVVTHIEPESLMQLGLAIVDRAHQIRKSGESNGRTENA